MKSAREKIISGLDAGVEGLVCSLVECRRRGLHSRMVSSLTDELSVLRTLRARVPPDDIESVEFVAACNEALDHAQARLMHARQQNGSIHV